MILEFVIFLSFVLPLTIHNPIIYLILHMKQLPHTEVVIQPTNFF